MGQRLMSIRCSILSTERQSHVYFSRSTLVGYILNASQEEAVSTFYFMSCSHFHTLLTLKTLKNATDSRISLDLM